MKSQLLLLNPIRNGASRRFLFIVFVLLILFHHLSALDPQRAITQHHLENWRIERGLPHNSVFCITQTPDGYLWIGTMNGLARYDGVRFVIFNRNNTPELNSSFIRTLCAGREGRLWIGTRDGGLTCLTGAGTFHSWSTAQYPFLNGIHALMEDQTGRLWIASASGGVAILENGGLNQYFEPSIRRGIRVNSFLEHPNGDIWIAAREGLFKKTGRSPFINVLLPGKTANSVVHALCTSAGGGVWVSGLDIVCHIRDQEMIAYRASDGLRDFIPICLKEDSNGALWIGYDGGGLSRLAHGHFEHVSTAEGLPNDFIFSIFEDHEKNIWFGSSENGIGRFSDTPFINFSIREGLAVNDVRSLLEAPSGEIIIGAVRGARRYNPAQRRLEPFFFQYPAIRGETIQNMVSDEAGNLWIGAQNGLYTILNNGQLRPFSGKDGLSCSAIRAMRRDNSGNIWVETHQGLFQYANGRFTDYSQHEYLKNTTIYCMETDLSDRLWLGTDHGLLIRENNTFRKIEDGKNLADAIIYTIYKNKNGLICLGARDNGLYCYFQNRFINITTQEGLAENWISIILGDAEGNLWLAGRFGVSRIDGTELMKFLRGENPHLHPTVYTEQDGLKSRKFHNCGITTRDGKLWFSGDEGIEVIDPARMVPSRQIPTVRIEEVMIDGEHRLPTSGGIRVPPGKKRLEFQYTAISFRNPHKIRFRVRLTPFDNEWLDMGGVRNAAYTGLTPGSYVFEVRACNSDGVWNPRAVSLPVDVQPFFYQTRWFMILTALVLIALTLGGVRLKIRRLIARERLLSKMVDERTHDLKDRTQQLEIAHKKLQKSKEIIEEKSRNILASIEYARRIQQAMLPRDEDFRTAFRDFFIIYKPKDIVSGDFYWFGRRDSYIYIAVVDCTGHGVPGALLTVAGKLLADEIMTQREPADPARLLTQLDASVRGALNREGGDSPTDDGMDAALCRINPSSGQILFSGAKRPLYVYQEKKLTEYRGSRKTLGGYHKKSPPTAFTNTEISFSSTITLYLASDGFMDQQNPENKKMGSRRFRELLQSVGALDPPIQKTDLLNYFEEFRQNEEQRDDVTLIGIQIEKKI